MPSNLLRKSRPPWDNPLHNAFKCVGSCGLECQPWITQVWSTMEWQEKRMRELQWLLSFMIRGSDNIQLLFILQHSHSNIQPAHSNQMKIHIKACLVLVIASLCYGIVSSLAKMTESSGRKIILTLPPCHDKIPILNVQSGWTPEKGRYLPTTLNWRLWFVNWLS